MVLPHAKLSDAVPLLISPFPHSCPTAVMDNLFSVNGHLYIYYIIHRLYKIYNLKISAFFNVKTGIASPWQDFK